mgnify:CR=1 FL=1
MEIDLPIGIKIGRKNYALNLNIYRNAHYQTLNKMKVEFSKVIEPELMKLPSFKSINLTYTLYPKTKRLCDIANVCSIVDKFFCDALVNIGKLPDDNYEYLKNITYTFGSIDKDNPRVTVKISGEINEDSFGWTRN